MKLTMSMMDWLWKWVDGFSNPNPKSGQFKPWPRQKVARFKGQHYNGE